MMQTCSIKTDKNNYEVPFSVKYWLRKAITYRKNDLISIYHKIAKKDRVLPLMH